MVKLNVGAGVIVINTGGNAETKPNNDGNGGGLLGELLGSNNGGNKDGLLGRILGTRVMDVLVGGGSGDNSPDGRKQVCCTSLLTCVVQMLGSSCSKNLFQSQS